MKSNKSSVRIKSKKTNEREIKNQQKENNVDIQTPLNTTVYHITKFPQPKIISLRVELLILNKNHKMDIFDINFTLKIKNYILDNNC